ncbi:MAG: hypothetical protein KIS91_14525 [Anaerolineae bacterium]|nr:hypothetical protein [Anaerolineae bacterium]
MSSSPTTSQPTSPYRWALPPEVEAEADPLHLRLDFHAESVVLHDHGEGVARTRLVSALDIAHVLARELDLTTGILPPDTLWWTKTALGVHVAVWREARVWTVRLREQYDARPRRLRLPMPGLVFVCLPARQPPYVFAAKARPRSPDDRLYHCPTYNVFATGRICTGSEVFPADPSRVPDAFFRSHFSPHAGQGKSQRYPDDIGRLWAELHRQPAYPLDDLVEHVQVADAMRLGD